MLVDYDMLPFMMAVTLLIILIGFFYFLIQFSRFLQEIRDDQRRMVGDMITIQSVIENYINVLNDHEYIKHQDDIEMLTNSVELHPDGRQSIQAMILKEH